MADITFYSSVRRGAAIAIAREDFSSSSGDADRDAHARLTVKLSYGGDRSAETDITLVGPGEIIGLDTRAVVRMFPKPDRNDAEAAFLSYVEFDQIDLPWRYTPARVSGSVSEATDRIRPWLFLLVLEEGTDLLDTDFRSAIGLEKLPQLTIRDPALLPSLDEAWAWAHVQGQAAMDEATMEKSLNDRQGPLVARLLSPRRLADSTAYRAFLVPTFKRGVLAAQGIDPASTDALAPAWTSGSTDSVTLPVYHSWRFQTGTISSFDEAARELRPTAELPDSVGLRGLDVSEPGLDLPLPIAGSAPMPIGGALQTGAQASAGEPTIATAWITALGDLVEHATRTLPDASEVRVVTPPLYGRWYAAETQLDRPEPVTNPPWFHRLNSDPRYRVGAALGTEVVQRDQQALMAAAWDQVERLLEVNRVRRVMQAGREIFTRLLTRHVNRGPTSTVLSTMGPLLTRVLSCQATSDPKPTLGAVVDGSPIGPGLRPPWRQIFPGDATVLIETINDGGFLPQPATPGGTNLPPIVFGGGVPGGLPDPSISTVVSGSTADDRLFWGVAIFWVARQLLVSEGGRYFWLLRKLLGLGLDLIALGSTQGVTQVNLAEKLRAGTLSPSDIQGAPPAPGFIAPTRDPDLSDPTTWPAPRIPGSTGSTVEANAFRDAVGALLGYMNAAPSPGVTYQKVDVAALVSCLLSSLQPSNTFAAAETGVHVFNETLAWNASDPLEPILLAPAIDKPMWQALRDISPEWILPGVGDVPRNTVSLLKTNQKFIESYMTGLNHEMTRELLWNGYPADQRSSYFLQFWDFHGWLAGKDESDRPEGAFADILPIASWSRTSSLGAHTGRQPANEHLVLLVRGDVINRYPNVVVYASKAKNAGLDDATQRHPSFQGTLVGDVAYYGFDIDDTFSETEIRGDGTAEHPGWFFVLQEHPSEPRFNQRSTSDPNVDPSDYVDPSTQKPAGAAAQLALLAYEVPVRVAFHAKDLLPPST